MTRRTISAMLGAPMARITRNQGTLIALTMFLPWLAATGCGVLANPDDFVDGTGVGGQGGDGTQGSGGTGYGGEGSNRLPETGIHFTNKDLPPGEVEESAGPPTEPKLGDPETVEYPYDPKAKDAPPKSTAVKMRSSCTTRTYDLASNPTKVLLHGVDNSITWPGALLQGGAYRDGSLRSLSLSDKDRAPVTVVIKDIYNNSGSSSHRTVKSPTFGQVTDAVSDMIVTGYEDDLPTGGALEYQFEETKEISRFMLKARVSARYGIAKGTLSSDIEKSSSHRTVVVQVTQRLFDVEVEEPPTQEAWFSERFFDETLPIKLEREEIGVDNPPVYVSKVTYGRILTYSLTTTASSSDIQGMVQASVKGVVGSLDASVRARYEAISSTAKVNVVSLGGNQTAALTAATTGDLKTFFEQDLKLTSAVPIAMEFKNLYDNTPAGISESGTFKEETCVPQLVVPGPFDFGLEDLHERPEGIRNIQATIMGDFNGDGRKDIVWNHIEGSENAFYVGYGGSSRMRVVEKPCANEICDFSKYDVAWGKYQPLSGDFTGNGMDDLLWVPKKENFGELGMVFYLLRATEDGFDEAPVKISLKSDELPENSFRAPVVADFNSDGKDDLIVTYYQRDGVVDRQDSQILLADDNLGFRVMPRSHDIANTNYSTETPLVFDVADVNSDGHPDLLWTLLGQELSQGKDTKNVTHIQLSDADRPGELFSAPGTFEHSSPNGWTNYRRLVGDYDGDGDVDLAFINPIYHSGEQLPVHQGTFEGSNFTSGPLQWWPKEAADASAEPTPYQIARGQGLLLATIDVNGDGPRDIVGNSFLGEDDSATGPLLKNAVMVMKGVRDSGDGFFNTDIEPQTHPVVQDWTAYTNKFVGDFNGDGLEDLMWNNAALDNSIFIAYAKRDAAEAAE